MRQSKDQRWRTSRSDDQRHGCAQTRPCFVEKETHLLHSIACSNLSVTSRAVRRVCMQRWSFTSLWRRRSKAWLPPAAPRLLREDLHVLQSDHLIPQRLQSGRGCDLLVRRRPHQCNDDTTPELLALQHQRLDLVCSASVTSPSCWARCLVSSIKEAARQ